MVKRLVGLAVAILAVIAAFTLVPTGDEAPEAPATPDPVALAAAAAPKDQEEAHDEHKPSAEVAVSCEEVHKRLVAVGGETLANQVAKVAVDKMSEPEIMTFCSEIGALPEEAMWAKLDEKLGMKRPQ
ncbi:MAG TPA: hypothetical protein PKA64_22725 [Myxococcota bacterium]|nr:hypothetical protein [Myxococcota bacterium]